MPWRNIPPDVLEYLMGLIAFVWAAGIGAMAKVASEVKMGIRKKFFSMELLLVGPSIMMTGILSYAIATYYELPLSLAMGLSTLSGYAGTRIADFIITHFERFKK